MALTYGFYNSYAGDRKYDAMQISEMFDGILADGIIPSQGQLFAVTAGGGMTINVGTGRAWFFHSWTKNDSVMMLTVPASDVSRPRIDAVVLEVNRDQEVRANSIKIVSGEAAVNPVKPTLVTTDKVHQYPLAYITVGAGVEEIKAENIENAVGLTPTPFATGVLETTPLDELWSQWEGEWDTWFANIKLQLSGDIVTNLQGQIDELREEHREDVGKLSDLIEMLRTGKSLVHFEVVDENEKPISGVVFISPAVTTDSKGKASTLVDANETFKPTINSYFDIESFSIPETTIIAATEYTIRIIGKRRNFAKITSSGTYYFTGECKKASFSIVGGGASGQMNYSSTGGGSGGSGGEVQNVENIIPAHLSWYEVSIGGGGGTPGAPSVTVAGGTTSVSTVGSANGGNLPRSGVNGETPYYVSYNTKSEYGPGSGGWGANGNYIGTYPHTSKGGLGGQIGGGKGGDVTTFGTGPNDEQGSAGSSGEDGGGGGGGGYYASGGRGGNGFVSISMELMTIG